jgi:uncharacterized protein (DUF608 family)
MAVITTTKQHESGIALGGIGCGSVELFPDGEFHRWQIANEPRWAERNNEKHVDDGESSTGALSFWVRTEDNANVIVRKLGMKTDSDDFTYRMFTWNKPVEKITFDGRFPVCDLTYEDSALPVRASMHAVSPFVPHNTDDSATPGFYIDINITNPTERDITVSVLSSIEPNFCNDGGCINSKFEDNDTVGIFMNTPQVQPWEKAYNDRNRGSLCYSAEGGEISYITADYFRFLREYVAGSDLGVSQESFLFGFRKSGSLPNTDVGMKPRGIPSCVSELKDEAIDNYLKEITRYPFALSLLNRVRHLKPDYPQTRSEKEEFLTACRYSIMRMGNDFGSCALCSKFTLAAGETQKVRYILTWYFPNHFGEYHNRLGHYYENLFKDAKEANLHLLHHKSDIKHKAEEFASLLYDTSLPQIYSDAWSVHLSTIVKCSWYLKDGKFGLWEGLGYCGFHTTDITYHASFGLLALFPELQKKQMKMGLKFQREDGRVHHFFTPDLEHVDNGYSRVDMNNQFVLMVCRDYLYTGDKEYFDTMWIPVQRAMDSIQELDRDGDGLPDTDTTRNTYDAWNFSGSPTYICVLWLSALKAGIKLAEIVGDECRREKWSKLLEKGLISLEEKLWNGEYYDLWRRDDENGTQIDGSLMTDQIDGEWFLRTSGIGGNLTDERVRAVLSRIYAGNYTPERGLVNATCPANKPVSLDTYENCQAEAGWTGIGYIVAALAMNVGLLNISDTIVGTIHSNQMRFGQFWDHWECGFRYTRPLSSWTTLISAEGLSVNSSEKILKLSPAVENLTAPLCTSDIIGKLSVSGDRCDITLVDGTLDGWTVLTPDSIKYVYVNDILYNN